MTINLKAFTDALNVVVSFAQWALTTAAGLLFMALLLTSLGAKAGITTRYLPAVPALELLCYGGAWACFTGMLSGVLKR